MGPLPHRAHKKFVETEGWECKGRVRAGSTGDHFRYTFTLDTGVVLYTKVSHGAGEIGDPDLVAQILREQLCVTEEEFWECVDRGTPPIRSAAPAFSPVAEPLDAKLLRNLIRKVGMSLSGVEGLSKAEAVARWHQYLEETGGEES
jgi:hypothetical protein